MAVDVRLLILVAEPSIRRAGGQLATLVRDLRSRPGVHCEVWALRHGPEGSPEPPLVPDRTIDDLRRWPPALALDLLGLRTLAGRLRGLRLRGWLRSARPSAVVLEGGVGGRVLPSGFHGPVCWLTFHESVAPTVAEATWTGPVAMEIHPPSQAPTVPNARATLGLPWLVDHVAPSRDSDRPMIVGWGTDGWVDGIDLFIRLPWHLEHRAGVVAEAVWYVDEVDPAVEQRLKAEAIRLGVEDRFRLLPDPGPCHRDLGDAVFLPYRGPVTLDEAIQVLGAGRTLVTFEPVEIEDPTLVVCPPLDLDAAAIALGEALALGREELVLRRIAVGSTSTWVDQFLAMLKADVAPR